MPEALILDAIRTPVGRYRGGLSSVRPDDLAAHVIRALVERNQIDPTEIEDVIFGAANQSGEDNRNVARMAALLAGLPDSVPGATVNRLCASGLEAVNQAARALETGDGALYIAGGVESMSRAPWVLQKPEAAFPKGDQQLSDTTIGWRLVNPRFSEDITQALGMTAENVAEERSISRERQDEFALRSHEKALEAREAGKFRDEIVAITPPPKRKAQPEALSIDEGPRRDTSLESLSSLPPVFKSGGSVTAGNSSPINDGASSLLLGTREAAEKAGIKPLGRIVSRAAAGVPPRLMGLGPIPAIPKALERAGIGISDVDLFEINEAFAAQELACSDALEIPMEKLNVNGGAIALGHPLGCSGARLITTLIRELNRRGSRFGVASMCVGVGQGVATVVEAFNE